MLKLYKNLLSLFIFFLFIGFSVIGFYTENLDFKFQNVAGEKLINTTSDINPTFATGGYFYYNNPNDGYLYRAKLNGDDKGGFGEKILSREGFLDNIYGGFAYDTNWQDNMRIYKFNIYGDNADDQGTPITNIGGNVLFFDSNYLYFVNRDSGPVTYKIELGTIGTETVVINQDIGYYDGEYVYYTNPNDGNKLYRVPLSDLGTLEGELIINCSNVRIREGNFIGDYIYYQNEEDSGRLYRIKKDGSDGLSYGEQMLEFEYMRQYVVNGDDLFFNNPMDGGYLYKKSISSGLTGDSVLVLDKSVYDYKFIGDFLYINDDINKKIYKFDNDNGILDKVVDITGYIYYDDSEYIYLNGYRIRKDGTNNDFYVFDDGLYVSQDVGNGVSHYSIDISIDETLSGNTNYELQLANIKNEDLLINFWEAGVSYDYDTINFMEANYMNYSRDEILAKLKIGDKFRLESDFGEGEFTITNIDGNLVYLDNDSPLRDLRGAQITLVDSNFTTVPTQYINGDTLDLSGFFGTISNQLYYKFILNGDEINNLSPIINSVSIEESYLAFEIKSTSPLDGALDFDTASNLEINFSKNVNKDILNGNIRFFDGEGMLPFTYFMAGTRLIINPSQNLAPSTIYSLVLGANIQDSLGENLGTDFTISFTTNSIQSEDNESSSTANFHTFEGPFQFAEIGGEKLVDVNSEIDIIFSDDSYIYYNNPEDGMSFYKAAKDGSDKDGYGTKVYNGGIRARNADIYSGYIYYEHRGVGGIMKFNLDGSDIDTGGTQVTDAIGRNIYMIDDKIYYMRWEDSYNLYRSTLGVLGTEEFIGSYENISFDDRNYYYNEPNDEFKLYRVEIASDGTVLSGSKFIDSPYFRRDDNFVDDEYIYYSNQNDNGRLYKKRKDGTDVDMMGTMVSDIEYFARMTVFGEYIYFANPNDNYYISRMAKDGTGVERLADTQGTEFKGYANKLYFKGDSDNKRYSLDINSFDVNKITDFTEIIDSGNDSYAFMGKYRILNDGSESNLSYQDDTFSSSNIGGGGDIDRISVESNASSPDNSGYEIYVANQIDTFTLFNEYEDGVGYGDSFLDLWLDTYINGDRDSIINQIDIGDSLKFQTFDRVGEFEVIAKEGYMIYLGGVNNIGEYRGAEITLVKSNFTKIPSSNLNGESFSLLDLLNSVTDKLYYKIKIYPDLDTGIGPTVNTISFSVPYTENFVVTSLYPENGSSDFGIYENVGVLFNNTVNESSLSGNIQLLQGTGSVDFNSVISGDILMLNPISGLEHNTRYDLILGADLENESGIKLGTGLSYWFVTSDVNFGVDSIIPAYGTGEVDRDIDIEILFNKEINEFSLSGNIELLQGTGSIDFVYNILSGNTLLLDPVDNLEYNTRYDIILSGGIEDTSNSFLGTGYNSWFMTELAPFDVVSSIPMDNAINVGVNDNIELLFTDILDESSLSGNIELLQGEESVEFTYNILSGTVLIVEPVSNLDYEREYQLILSENIYSLEGISLGTERSYNFTTEEVPFFKVISIYPEDGSINIDPESRIEIEFSNLIDDTSLNGNIELLQGSGSVEFISSLSGRVLIVEPVNNLEYGERYDLSLSGGILDVYGSELGTGESLGFTVSDVPILDIISTTPSNNEILVVDQNIEIVFEDVLNESTLSGNIQLIQGEEPIEFTYNVLSGTVLIVEPVSNLDYEREYQLILSENIYSLEGISLGTERSYNFTTEEVPFFKVISIYPEDGSINIDPESKIEIEFSNLIDDTSLNGNIELLQGSGSVEFISSLSGRVLIVEPVNNLEYRERYDLSLSGGILDVYGSELGTGIDIGFETKELLSIDMGVFEGVHVFKEYNPRIYFNNEIDEDTLSGNIYLLKGEDEVEFTTSFWGNYGTTLIINPVNDLDYESRYDIIITKGVKDVYGTSLSKEYNSWFITEAAPLEILDTSPLKGDEGVKIDTNIEIKFNNSLNIYNLDGNIELLQGTGNVNCEISVISGNTVLIDPVNELEYKERYDVILKEGISDRNGYFLSTGYNLRFETQRPFFEVISIYPEDESINIDPESRIEIEFSNLIDDTSLNGNIELLQGSGSIEFISSLSGRVLIVEPVNNLEYGERYDLSLSGGILDVYGSELGTGESLGFTVSDVPILDIISTTPSNNEILVVDQNIEIVFEDVLNESTLSGNIQLIQGEEPIEFTYNVLSGTVLIVEPVSNLDYEREYQLILSENIYSLEGISLGTERSYNFTTEEVPFFKVISIYPEDGSINIDPESRIEIEFSNLIDDTSLNGNIELLQGSGSVEFISSLSGRVLIVEPVNNLEYRERYDLSLSGGILDVYGSELGTGIDIGFETKELLSIDMGVFEGVHVFKEYNPRIYFNNEIDEDTLSGNIYLLKGEDEVEFTTSFWGNYGTTLIINPVNDLDYESRYDIIITKGVKDVYGTSLSKEYNSWFITEAAPLEILDTSPLKGDEGVKIDTNIEIKFNNSLNIYNLDGNIELLQGTGNVNCEISVISGNTVLIDPVNELEYKERYDVILKEGISDRNGYFLSTGYNLRFETQRPFFEVISIYPEDESINIDPESRIEIEFSNLIDDTSLNGNIELLQGSGSIEFISSLSGRVLIVEPVNNLEYGERYDLSLSGGILDVYGSELGTGESLGFTVSDVPILDIISTTPSNNEILVVDQNIEIVFEDVLNESTLSGNIQLIQGEEPIEFTYNILSGNTLTIDPVVDLDYQSYYELILSSNITSIEGFNLVFDRSYSFTTNEIFTIISEIPDGSLQSTKTYLIVTFNNIIDESTLSGNIHLLNGDEEVDFIVSFYNGLNKIKIVPLFELEFGTIYDFKIDDSLKDINGNYLNENFSGWFKTISGPLEIITTKPLNESTNIEKGNNIEIVFNNDILTYKLNDYVKLLEGNENIDFSLSLSGKNCIILNPTDLLKYGTKYDVILDEEIVDIDGNHLLSGNNLWFETEHIPLELLSITPEYGALDLGNEMNIIMTFNNYINENSLSGNIELLQGSLSVDYITSVNSGNNVIIDPISLEYNKRYDLIIKDGIKDIYGDNLSGFDLWFKTEYPPLDVLQTIPYNNYSDFEIDKSIEIEFNNPILESSLSGNIELLQGTGNIEFATSIIGENKLIVNPSENLKYNTRYNVILKEGIKDDKNRGILGTEYEFRFTTEHTPLVVSGINPELGNLEYSIDGNIEIEFNNPILENSLSGNIYLLKGIEYVEINTSVKSGNILVINPVENLDFQTRYDIDLNSGLEDIYGSKLPGYNSWFETKYGALEVISSNPDDGFVGFVIDDNIEIDFNNNIDESSFSGNIQLLLGTGSVDFIASTTYGNTLIIDPMGQLDYERQYNVILNDGIKDTQGNYLLSGHTFGFDTEYFPVGITSINPENGADSVELDADIQVNFNNDINESSLTGKIEILQGTENINFTASIISGNVLLIDPINNFEYKKKYNIILNDGIEDIHNSSLTGFTFRFESKFGPLEVISTNPLYSSQGLDIDDNIEIKFNNDIDELSLSGNIVILNGTGTIEFIANVMHGNVLVIDPIDDLNYETEYQVVLNNEIEDIQGNLLLSGFEFSFETRLIPIDVVSVDPIDGQQKVYVDKTFEILFDDDLKESTLDENISLLKGEELIQFDKSLVSGNMILIDPIDNLDYYTNYILVLGSEITNLSGSDLDKNINISFTTQGPELIVYNSIPIVHNNDFMIDRNIEIIFSNPIDLNSLSGMIQLNDLTGAVDFTYTIDDRILYINPNNDLLYNTDYEIVISDNIEDIYGSNLNSIFNLSFTTEDIPPYTIWSELDGGNWSDVTTWKQGRIPVESDIVGIRKNTIVVDEDITISGLYVLDEGELVDNNVDKNITIQGNIYNNGIIKRTNTKYTTNGDNRAGLTLNIYGDIENNGSWNTDYNKLMSYEHSFTGTEIIFGATMPTINLAFNGDESLIGKLNLGGKVVTIPGVNAQLNEIIGDGEINGSGDLAVIGSCNSNLKTNYQRLIFDGESKTINGSYEGNELIFKGTNLVSYGTYSFQTISYDGDFDRVYGAILGDLVVRGDVVVRDELLIEGNLHILSGGALIDRGVDEKIIVKGNIINDGSIKRTNVKNGANRAGLTFDIYGDIENNGDWNTDYNYLMNSEHEYRGSSIFGGYTTPTTDLTINSNSNLIGNLNLSNKVITILGGNADLNDVNGNGIINGTGGLTFKGSTNSTLDVNFDKLIFDSDEKIIGTYSCQEIILKGSNIINGNFIGNTVIEGRVDVMIWTVDGDLHILSGGVLSNDYSSKFDRKAIIKGDIINEGLIKDNNEHLVARESSGGRTTRSGYTYMNLELYGGLYNYGTWNSYSNYLMNEEHIFGGSNMIGGTTIPTFSITTLSGEEGLIGELNFKYKTYLDAKYNTKKIIISGENGLLNKIEHHGRIVGNGTLTIKGAMYNTRDNDMKLDFNKVVFDGSGSVGSANIITSEIDINRDSYFRGELYADNITINGNVLFEGYLHGNVIINGKLRTREYFTNLFYGTTIYGNLNITENAILIDNNYHATVKVFGDVINRGQVLRTNNKYLSDGRKRGGLFIDVYGSILSFGEWITHDTKVRWESVSGVEDYQIRTNGDGITWDDNDDFVYSSPNNWISVKTKLENNDMFYRSHSPVSTDNSGWSEPESINGNTFYDSENFYIREINIEKAELNGEIDGLSPLIKVEFNKKPSIYDINSQIYLENWVKSTLPLSINIIEGEEENIYYAYIKPKDILYYNEEYKLIIEPTLKSSEGLQIISGMKETFRTPSELSDNTDQNRIYSLGAVALQDEERAKVVKNNTKRIIYEQDLANIGDPVTLSTGEFQYYNRLLYISSNELPYSFDLTYKNQTYYNGPVGVNWDHNYNIKLIENIDGSLDLYDGKLGVFNIARYGDNYEYIDGLEANLLTGENGLYIVEFADGKKYYFNNDLKISEINDIHGNDISFRYGANGNLSEVDTNEGVINYLYYDNNRLYRVVDFNGRYLEFNYYSENDVDGSIYDLKDVKLVISELEKTIKFTYYKDSNNLTLSNNLKELYDSKGQIYVSNIFDNNDRVISQNYGDGIIYYEYTTEEDRIQKNKVTNKKGNITEYIFDENGNILEKNFMSLSGDRIFKYEYNGMKKLSKEVMPNGNAKLYYYDLYGNMIEEIRLEEDVNFDVGTGEVFERPENMISIEYEYYNPYNTISRKVNADGSVEEFETDDLGNITKHALYLSGSLEEADALVTLYEYDGFGYMRKKIDPMGNEALYEYDNGKLTLTKLGTGDNIIITRNEYDDYGNLTKTIDGEGNYVLYTYDEFDRVESITTQGGISSSFQYDENNNKTQQTMLLEDGTSLITNFEYDVLDNMTSIEMDMDDSRKIKTTYEYDLNGQLSKVTDSSGFTTNYLRNEAGKITEKRLLAEGVEDMVTKYEYDLNDNTTVVITPNGASIHYEYDGFDRIIKAIDQEGNYKTYLYDKAGNTIKTTSYGTGDVLLSEISYEYDGFGNRSKESILNIDTGEYLVNQYFYNKNNQIIKSIDAKGNESLYTYDLFGRLESLEKINGISNLKEVYVRDSRGLLVNKKTYDGDVLRTDDSYIYDSDGRLIKQTDINGDFLTYEYNNLSQMIEVVDKESNKTKMKYDYLGNLLEKKTLNASGVITSIITFEYDIVGNLIKLTDAEGNITTYEYNGFNKPTKQTFADGSYVTYSYDVSGNLKSQIDPNGNEVTNIYDKLSRLIGRNIDTGTNVGGVTSETFAYDGLGRLISANDSDGDEVSFEYDSLGNIIGETNNGKTLAYKYDNNGNLIEQIYPMLDGSSRTITRAYDEFDRLSSINSTINSETNSVADYTYDGVLLSDITYGNGTNTTYEYDNMLRLSQINHLDINDSIIKKYDYTYDKVGNMLSNGHDSYEYDDLYRIIDVTYQGGNTQKETFQYDTMGNRTNHHKEGINYIITNPDVEIPEMVMEEDTSGEDANMMNILARAMSGSAVDYYELTGETVEFPTQEEREATFYTWTGESINQDTSYETNELNQYIALTGDVNQEIEYDNNGNIIDNGKFRFKYDYKNRIILVECSSVNSACIDGSFVASFNYDPIGRRTKKTTNAGETQYIYTNQNIAQEIHTGTGDVVTTKEYIYGENIDDIISVIHNREEYYYHKNHQNSVIAISNANGNVIEEYKYDVFGRVYQKSIENGMEKWYANISSVVDNTRFFTGREWNSEIDLYYYRARYYDAELGRFISRDPIGYQDDINLYAYVVNNSLKYIDPMGYDKRFFGEMGEGARYGDLIEDQSIGNILGQALFSSIPRIGWTRDGMDGKIANDKCNNGDKIACRVDQPLVVIGFTPFLGDALKAGTDLIRKVPGVESTLKYTVGKVDTVVVKSGEVLGKAKNTARDGLSYMGRGIDNISGGNISKASNYVGNKIDNALVKVGIRGSAEIVDGYRISSFLTRNGDVVVDDLSDYAKGELGEAAAEELMGGIKNLTKQNVSKFGTQGFDGVYIDGKGKIFIMESKFGTAGLNYCKRVDMKDCTWTKQMDRDWIKMNANRLIDEPSATESDVILGYKIINAIENGKIERVLVKTEKIEMVDETGNVIHKVGDTFIENSKLPNY